MLMRPRQKSPYFYVSILIDLTDKCNKSQMKLSHTTVFLGGIDEQVKIRKTPNSKPQDIFSSGNHIR